MPVLSSLLSGLRPAVPLALALALTACAPPQALKKAPPEPIGWIESLPEEWADEPVIALAESVTVSFFPRLRAEGVHAREERVGWYFVRRDIPAVLENLAVHDVEFLESTPNAEAQVWRRDPQGGWTRDPEFIFFTRSPYDIEWAYASSHYVTTARVPRYRSGIVVRRREVHTYGRLEFLSGETLRGTVPTLRKVVTLRAPGGTKLRSGLLNREGLAVSDTTYGDSLTRVRVFEARRLPARSLVSVPRPETWYASAQYSPPVLTGGISPTWRQLGDRYLQMAEPFLRRDSTVASLARGLAPKDASPAAVADSAFAHIRENYRYHADERSIHAFVPRRVDYVRRQGWGDCKELSALFAALLRERGLETRLALITLRPSEEPSPEYPTLGKFNHLVAAWRDGDAWRFVDATVNYGDASSSSFHLIGRSALLLEGGASRLVTVEPWPDWRNRVTTHSSVSRTASGWEVKGRMRVEGQMAHELHPFLLGLKGEERSVYLNQWLRSTFGFERAGATVREADWRRVELDYQGPYDQAYLAVDKGGLALDEPRLWGSTVQYTSRRVEGPREFTAFEQTDFWSLPPEFNDFEGGSFSRPFATGSWSRDSSGYRREYRQQAGFFFPEDSAAVRGFFHDRKKFMRKNVWKP